MKKIFLLLALLSLTALCLFACGNPEEDSSTEESQRTSETKGKTEDESSTECTDPEWTPPVK